VVLVKIGSEAMANEFVAIEQNGLVVLSGRSDEHGRFSYSLSGNPVRVRVGSSAYFGPFDLSLLCNSSEPLNLTDDLVQNQTANESFGITETDSVEGVSDDSYSDSNISQTPPSPSDNSQTENFVSNSTSSSSTDSNSMPPDSAAQVSESSAGFGLIIVIVFVAILGGFSVYWFLLRK
jgi:hypothetical protein